MSLFNTLNTGATGLGAAGLSLSVIGDNIANLSTAGFKRNRANFADMIPGTVGTMSGPGYLGRGVRTAAMVTEFDAGSFRQTGSALDVAVSGVGWFQVSDGNADFYTRDGSFSLDADNYLVTATGLRVQGYAAENDAIGPVVTDLRLNRIAVPPRETTEVTLEANLVPTDPDALVANALQGFAGQLDGSTVSITQVGSAADFSTSLTVFDSLGRPHEAVLVFEMTAEAGSVTDWDYSVVVDGGEADIGGVAGVDGMALEIQSGTLSFDDGVLTTTANPPVAGWDWPGATPFAPNIDLSSMTYSGGEDFAVRNVTQDGVGVGDLARLEVTEEGVVLGQYTNGEQSVLGQLALATFQAESGLERAGGNLFRSTLVSGGPAMSGAGVGTRGTISGYTLEGSNVKLEDEFVSMIQSQRMYQANASVVTTVDETLQELVNLV